MAKKALTSAQGLIYACLEQKVNDDEIKRRLGISDGVLKAQKTRILNAGWNWNSPAAQKTTGELNNIFKNASEARHRMHSHDEKSFPDEAAKVQCVLEGAGAANFKLTDVGSDVHPMVLLGVTIQFVKLCGGRINAHQVIEDVYGALNSMMR